MDKYLASYPSHLFTVRVWLEDLGNGRTEWRGQVSLVASGETRYFREWPALISHLTELLALFASASEEAD